MPTYAYRCEECGDFDWRQPMSDPPLRSCPECEQPVRRLISGGAGFIVKGRGGAQKGGGSKTCCGRSSSCGKSCGTCRH